MVTLIKYIFEKVHLKKPKL